MKTTQKTTQNSTQTSTPNNPAYVTGGLESLTGDVMNLRNLDPYSLVPGATPLQERGAAITGGLTGSPWNWDMAADITRGVGNQSAPQVESQSLLTNLEDYYNPYRDQVTNAAMADFDANAGRTRAQQDLNVAGQSAFGDSGASLARSLTEGELARGRNTQLSGLLSDMFKTSVGFSADDANRRQSASGMNAQLEAQNRQTQLQSAGLLGDLSSSYDATQRANAGQAFDMGEIMRQIQQQQAQAPISTTADIASIFAGLPYGLTRGETTTGTSTGKTSGGGGLGGLLGSLGTAAFGLGSLGFNPFGGKA